MKTPRNVQTGYGQKRVKHGQILSIRVHMFDCCSGFIPVIKRYRATGSNGKIMRVKTGFPPAGNGSFSTTYRNE